MNEYIKSLYKNAIFNRALLEFESLGFKITCDPEPGALPYAVIGGRSNARWWLIPLQNRYTVKSGLSMFQPILFSAQVMKSMAATLTTFGLSGCWARNRLYISGKSLLDDVFEESKLQYSFFTGTDSPHRKSTVQIIDEKGALRGYAKISCNSYVIPLLTHEAATLNHIANIELKSAIVPSVQYCDHVGDSFALVTDTIKSPKTKTVNRLQNIHLDFLTELGDKTVDSSVNSGCLYSDVLISEYRSLSDKLAISWQSKISNAIDTICKQELVCTTSILSHGDFTPSNTFLVRNRLYVFDWEYAGYGYPPFYDLIHFLISSYRYTLKSNAASILKKILSELNQFYESKTAKAYLLIYLLKNVLFYLKRDLLASVDTTALESYKLMSELIDAAILSTSQNN